MQNTQNQAIWNPSTVSGLSFVFTPAFGSYLQASNWKALGQPERAAASKVWFLVSLVVLAAMAAVTVGFAGKTAAGNDAIRGFINGGGLIYFFIWYVASGRHQVRYVKEGLGKTYAKKSMVKPVLAALACAVAYAFVVFGLLFVTHGSGDDDPHAAEPASSGGSSFSLASLFDGAAKLDCGAVSVKQYVTDTYSGQLAKSGIPDLMWALADKRIKVSLDAMHETARNDQSKNVQCAANLIIEFPKDDLERAAHQSEIFTAMMQVHGFAPVSDTTITMPITYQVATPADEAERKQGVQIVSVDAGGDAATDKLLRTYAAYYEVLSFSTPDITAASVNTKPWDKDFKDNAIQSCSKSLGVEKCTCRMNAFEKIVGDKDMGRIGFTMQTSMVFGGRYENFKKLAAALDQQCPMTQSLAAVLGDHGAVADVPASPVPESTAVPASDVTQPEAGQSTPAAIVASFDCSKAASKIEKLICSSPQTADADRRLTAVYHAAASKSADQATLKQQQRDWLKERNACDDAACLLNVTAARINALSAM
ncbi:lysozyme inhibitor LprI family protein [Paraburkholderia lacunae]|nr:lysozyme inhibitor LprI family protein [Paraburkholderia lacunae]